MKNRRNVLGKRDPSVSQSRPYMYQELQNKTCLLAPDTIFGPYDVDGELHRHDVREGQEGVNLYLDLGLIDVETCEALPDAWLTIWVCDILHGVVFLQIKSKLINSRPAMPLVPTPDTLESTLTLYLSLMDGPQGMTVPLMTRLSSEEFPKPMKLELLSS